MSLQQNETGTGNQLPKCPTGIAGLDEITGGGLPRGRPTLVCGGAGCGKTLLAMEFLVRGATQFDEPGVFMAFEETAEELAKNVASLGFDLPTWSSRQEARHRLRPRRARARSRRPASTTWRGCSSAWATPSTRSAPSGGPRHDRVAVRRPVQRGHPARRTAAAVPLAQGQGRHRHHHRRARRRASLTRHGLEEYVSDCVILLDHRVERADLHPPPARRQVPRLGPRHQRVSLPDRRAGHLGAADHLAGAGPRRHAPSGSSPGVPRLDAMLGGKGYYRGSSVLVSGTAGTGKTSLAAAFRRCRLPARRAVPVLRLRGVARADHPQHALHRPRPGSRGSNAGPAAFPRRAAHPLRAGDAPGDHAQAGERVQAHGRGRRPGDQPDHGRAARRRSRRC